MSKRRRHYLVTAVTVLAAVAYSRIAGDVRDLDFYAGGAALIAAIVVIGVPFVELAKDSGPRPRRSRG